jgi:hypothetical protein
MVNPFSREWLSMFFRLSLAVPVALCMVIAKCEEEPYQWDPECGDRSEYGELEYMTTWTYDDLNRPTTMNHQIGKFVSYGSTVIQFTTYTYFGDEKMLAVEEMQRHYEDGTMKITDVRLYSYTNKYDLEGVLTRRWYDDADDGEIDTIFRYYYYDNGLLRSETRDDDADYYDDRVTTYKYDEAGRLQEEIKVYCAMRMPIQSRNGFATCDTTGRPR